jgi:hypothetical protein
MRVEPLGLAFDLAVVLGSRHPGTGSGISGGHTRQEAASQRSGCQSNGRPGTRACGRDAPHRLYERHASSAPGLQLVVGLGRLHEAPQVTHVVR